MQSIYFADFTFVYISKKKTPLFGELIRICHFWTFIFVQKGKTNRLLENTTFFILYILLIFLLKEKRNTPLGAFFSVTFFQLFLFVLFLFVYFSLFIICKIVSFFSQTSLSNRIFKKHLKQIATSFNELCKFLGS